MSNPSSPVGASTEWSAVRGDDEPGVRLLERLVTSWSTLALQADPPERRSFLEVMQRSWARWRLPARMLKEALDYGVVEHTGARLVRRFLREWPALRDRHPRERAQLLVDALTDA